MNPTASGPARRGDADRGGGRGSGDTGPEDGAGDGRGSHRQAAGAGRTRPRRPRGQRPGASSRGQGRHSEDRAAWPVDRPPPTQVEPSQPVDVHDPEGVRLQKLLAAAGWGSRRACEAIIAQGRVEVDGHVVRDLGVRIDPVRRTVRVDGSRVVVDQSRTYLALNKPRGVVSTMSDDRGRACIGDLLGRRSERLFHVGRLDADTDGLLLLTNDGDLAHHLQHPGFGVEKTYVALVDGLIPRDLGRRLREGVDLEDGPVKVDSFRVLDAGGGRSLVELTLHEGRKHVVRRLLDEVGHPVRALTRTAVGPIRLGDLRPGKLRPLTAREIADLFTVAGL